MTEEEIKENEQIRENYSLEEGVSNKKAERGD